MRIVEIFVLLVSSSVPTLAFLSQWRPCVYNFCRLNAAEGGIPTPGAPIVTTLDKEKNVASITLSLSGTQTQEAFLKSCDAYNDEVKSRGLKVAGFRPGAKLPPNYLYQIFGEEKVKSLCGALLAEEIQEEVEKTGMTFVGRGRITAFNAESFVAGKPHVISVECDLWPDITYGDISGGGGYKGLKLTVPKGTFDKEKFESVKKSILERYKVLEPTPVGYAAQLGDVVTANMAGYEKNLDGSKGAALPAIAKGDNVDISLEAGKFMEGLIEGVVGAITGDVREISVKFPPRPTGPGAALSGKEALFEVSVLAIKTKAFPQWDEALAGRIRDGLTLAELESEVREAVDGEAVKSVESLRNDEIAKALLEKVVFNRIPETLIEENTQVRFENMLMEFQESGSTREQLQEMSTPEKYGKYKEISRPNVEKIVKLGLTFRDIAEKEKIVVTEKEITEQLDLINAQSKQKGEEPPDERRARDEIENTLLRKKVFDFLASHAEITWVEPVQA